MTLVIEDLLHSWLPLLPELDRLRGLVENSDWHNDDPYEQSLRLARWVADLPAGLGDFAGEPVDGMIRKLDEPAVFLTTRRSLRELLVFAALVHDLGKAETYQRLPDGSTRCPDHEQAGADLIPALCDRFDFNPEETEWLTRMVEAHGEPYALFKSVGEVSAREQSGAQFTLERAYFDVMPELLILALGDLVTSHLQYRNPLKYRLVLDYYYVWLGRLLADWV
jgi:hypothetical protein